MAEPLPSFERPPVHEVVMGVQFEPLVRMLAPHVGKFWAIVESAYPVCSEHAPIAPQIENFAIPGTVAAPGITFSRKPDLPRVFLQDAGGHWVIQIQRDRFLHNWRIVSDPSEYPRYPTVSHRFFEQWSRFQQFVAENQLGPIQIVQLEITYLNRIPLESTRIGEFFPDFRWREGERYLSAPEAVELTCSFRSEADSKRLRVTVRPNIHEDQQEMLYELTVRGNLAHDEGLEKWFGEGREWIVKAFADLASEEWHRKWGRTA